MEIENCVHDEGFPFILPL